MRAAMSPPGSLALRARTAGARSRLRRAVAERTVGKAGQGRHPPFPDLLHHLLHLLAGGHELVDLLDGHARPGRDALAARAVDEVRQPALLGRHRQDDRLDTRELALVDLHVLQLAAEPGD